MYVILGQDETRSQLETYIQYECGSHDPSCYVAFSRPIVKTKPDAYESESKDHDANANQVSFEKSIVTLT